MWWALFLGLWLGVYVLALFLPEEAWYWWDVVGEVGYWLLAVAAAIKTWAWLRSGKFRIY